MLRLRPGPNPRCQRGLLAAKGFQSPVDSSVCPCPVPGPGDAMSGLCLPVGSRLRPKHPPPGGPASGWVRPLGLGVARIAAPPGPVSAASPAHVAATTRPASLNRPHHLRLARTPERWARSGPRAILSRDAGPHSPGRRFFSSSPADSERGRARCTQGPPDFGPCRRSWLSSAAPHASVCRLKQATCPTLFHFVCARAKKGANVHATRRRTSLVFGGCGRPWPAVRDLSTAGGAGISE